jgi:serine/threonine protein kinase
MPGIEGSTLGRYELRHRIARGGMAEVYLGYDRRVRRRVAVKVLYGSDEPFVRRFEREAEAVGTLSHDHILPLYDFGEQRPWYYLVMPYVEGGTLRDYLLKRERLDLEEAGSFLAQIAAALQFAHDHGVVHRDVKPSNILLRPDGHAYLGDFGLAKATMGAKAVTHSGSMVGTPEYMAPEQSNGVHDYRSDIYSLGIILYQMLTGRVPFTADSPVAVSLKHIQANPRPPGELNSAISPAIEAVILKALAKDPDERYQQAEALAEAYWNALGVEQGELKDNAQPLGSKPELRLQKNEKTVGTPSAVTQVVDVAETMPRAEKLRRFPLKAPAPPLRSSRKKRLLVALPICLVLILGSALSLAHLWQPHGNTLQTRPRNGIATPRYQATATAQAQLVQATLAAQSRVQATAGITSAIGAGDVLYADAMTTPGGGWVNDGSQCYFSSEGYHVYSALAHAVAWCYSGQQSFSNTIITAQAMLMHGDLYGLIFRLSPLSKSFYVLELNSQGDYRFVLAQGSNPLNWLTLIDWTHSSAITSGYGQTNTFLVMATRNHFRFYINKQLIVSSFSDSTYASGMIGFLAGGDSNGGTEATFSNIWVFQK